MNMKFFMWKTMIVLLFLMNVCFAQTTNSSSSGTIEQKWWTVDNGGAKASGSGFTLTSSIGQPAVQSMSGAALTMESGYIPGARTLSGTFTSLAINFAGNWNMVSVPLLVNDYAKTTLFPSAVSFAYSYANGYQRKDTLAKNLGYWIKLPAASEIRFSGAATYAESIDVSARWNMVGCISSSVPVTNVVPVGTTRLSPFYSFSTDGYGIKTTLEPGKAYWVKVSAAGKLVLRPSTLLEGATASVKGKSKSPSRSVTAVSDPQPELQALTITDAKGRERTLYYSSSEKNVDLDQYELPPIPPAGIFDIRFGADQSAAVVDMQKSGAQTFPIQVKGSEYPLKVKWASSRNAWLVIDGKQVTLDANGEATIPDEESSVKLKLSPSSTSELPKEFAVFQNYPNPFNPSTSIRYDLPEDVHVTLTIYNMLGQEVVTLIDGAQEAGYKTQEWNAVNYSSGIYYYRVTIQSEKRTFTELKSMVLVK